MKEALSYKKNTAIPDPDLWIIPALPIVLKFPSRKDFRVSIRLGPVHTPTVVEHISPRHGYASQEISFPGGHQRV